MATTKPAPRRRDFAISDVREGAREATFVASTSNPVLAPDGVLEVLDSDWDLSAYQKHPVILRNHNMAEPVGRAEEISAGPGGLTIRVRFGTARTGAAAEETWNQVLEQMVRGMSVRWDGGTIRMEDRDGVPVRVVSRPRLVEASIVTVPMDEDAGVVGPSEAPEVTVAPELEQQRSAPPAGERPACASCDKRSKLGKDYSSDDCMVDQRARAATDDEAAKSCRALEPTAEEDDDAKQFRASIVAAARLLRSARAFKPKAPPFEAKTDEADCDRLVLKFDQRSRLGKVERTPLGGARIPVRMTRTGILSYPNRERGAVHQLRLAEDVEASLRTLVGAPVVIGHPYELGGLVDAKSFRLRTVGHVESAKLDEQPHTDGERWVSGVIVVQDEAALDAIDRGELEGVSVGYQSLEQKSPGEYRGKHFDLLQRGIINNHLAILPPKRGRAGVDAALRLDASDAACVEDDEEETMTIKIIKLDGNEYEYGSAQHITKLDEMHRGEIKTLTDTHASALGTKTKELETLTAKCDSLTADNAKLTEKLTTATDSKTIDALVNARVSLLTNAGRVLGPDVKLDGLTDREIMIEVIKLDQKEFTGKGPDGKDRSADYIAASFDHVVAKGVRNDSIDSVVNRANVLRTNHLDSRDGIADDDPVVVARLEAQDRAYGIKK